MRLRYLWISVKPRCWGVGVFGCDHHYWKGHVVHFRIKSEMKTVLSGELVKGCLLPSWAIRNNKTIKQALIIHCWVKAWYNMTWHNIIFTHPISWGAPSSSGRILGLWAGCLAVPPLTPLAADSRDPPLEAQLQHNTSSYNHGKVALQLNLS